MALQRLLSLIAESGVQPELETVARWTEAPGNETWDAEPEYGAFVDENGLVVNGSAPSRAFLESDDPTQLELAPETARALGENVTLVFLDWGRQNLSWEEIFELWSAWEAQDMVADCGSVGVSWTLASRWVAPCWVAFRGSFNGEPLSVALRQAAREPSFLAKARQWRPDETSAVSEEELPMVPFTLDDLKNPGRRWPEGVA